MSQLRSVLAVIALVTVAACAPYETY
ncbi:MAG: hypothetical protein K0R53_2581, partial [Burkholderiales bacterium]|nr:hypothetical protein [Burkholderiales bacterium]